MIKIKDNVFEVLAKIIQNCTVYYAEETVGKSFPVWTYEVEMPKEFKD